MKKKNPLKELGIKSMTVYDDVVKLHDDNPVHEESKTYWMKHSDFLQIALGNYDFEAVPKKIRTWIEPIKK